MRRVIIMGAAGRDFHNFNTFFRNNPDYKVICFTATQIPNIDGRKYPKVLSGKLYPKGIPIYPESELKRLIVKLRADIVVFSYSDISHDYVMHKASEVIASGADFWLLGNRSSMLKSKRKVIAICATRTGAGKSQTTRRACKILQEKGVRFSVIRHPMPYGNLSKQIVQRFSKMSDLDRHNCTIEEREEYEPHLDRGILGLGGRSARPGTGRLASFAQYCAANQRAEQHICQRFTRYRWHFAQGRHRGYDPDQRNRYHHF